MNRSLSLGWRILNPIEWAKALYGLVGARYPTTSLIGAMVVGALAFGAIWMIAAQQYEKDRPKATQPSSRSLEKQPALSSSTPMSEKPPETGGYRDKLTIHGPDGVDFLVYPSDGRYLCKFRNGPSVLKSLQVIISTRRSFDAAGLLWRDAVPFSGMMGPTRSPTEPGEFTQEFNFAVAVDGALRIGDHSASILRWPSGDPSQINRWRIGMRVKGLSKEWPIDLCLRWVPGTNNLGLMEYSDAIPLANF